MRKMASKETAEPVMSLDDIVKTLEVLDDSTKLSIFMKKYDELHKLYRTQEFCYNTTKRELSSVNADKNKQILARSRLEGLCRELQKQNKVIKDESLLKLREEEEKRKHITQEFQKTLNNVTTMMTESNAQNNKLGEENKQMAQRLSSIYEEFKTRENEVDRISKQIDIERQLAEARCAKMKTEFMIEKQTLIAENEVLNSKVSHLTKELLESSSKCVLLEHQVADLTAQVEKYTGKYEEFESTISRSGKVFDHCKTEIAKMNKQIKALEKEIVEWQNRYHKNISTIYELQMENEEKGKVIDNVTKKQNQLTKLCRQLQAERKAYINTLRNLGQNPNDIPIEVVDDEPAIEEPQPGKSGLGNLTSGDPEDKSGDAKFSTKNKPPLKGKRGKQKAKKGKEAPSESTTRMTLKEIQLAELKEELDRVRRQVFQIQSLEAAMSTMSPETEVASNVEKSNNDKTDNDNIEEIQNESESIEMEHPDMEYVEKSEIIPDSIYPQIANTEEDVQDIDISDKDSDDTVIEQPLSDDKESVDNVSPPSKIVEKSIKEAMEEVVCGEDCSQIDASEQESSKQENGIDDKENI